MRLCTKLVSLWTFSFPWLNVSFIPSDCQNGPTPALLGVTYSTHARNQEVMKTLPILWRAIKMHSHGQLKYLWQALGIFTYQDCRSAALKQNVKGQRSVKSFYSHHDRSTLTNLNTFNSCYWSKKPKKSSPYWKEMVVFPLNFKYIETEIRQ